jgi:protein required for attachment to host cells
MAPAIADVPAAASHRRHDASSSPHGGDTSGAAHWVLVAGATLGCLYERRPGEPALTLIRTFEAAATSRVRQEAVPLAAGSPRGHAVRAGLPQTMSAQRRRHLQFAGVMAAALQQGLADSRCRAITMVAACPFLGALRRMLSPAARLAVSTVIDEDLGDMGSDELQGELARRGCAAG